MRAEVLINFLLLGELFQRHSRITGDTFFLSFPLFLDSWFRGLVQNRTKQWRIQRRGPGGLAPLIFGTKWGPKGRKKIFWDRPPLPRLSISQSLGDRPPPPYLKVWTRHCKRPPRVGDCQPKYKLSASPQTWVSTIITVENIKRQTDP